MVTCDGQKSIRFWATATGKELRRIAKKEFERQYVNYLAVSPNGKMLATCSSGGARGALRLWDMSTGQKLFDLPEEMKDLRFCLPVFSPDGNKLFVSSGCAIRCWDLQSRKEANRLDEHEYEVNHVVFSPDGKMLATADKSGDDFVGRREPQEKPELHGKHYRPELHGKH